MHDKNKTDFLKTKNNWPCLRDLEYLFIFFNHFASFTDLAKLLFRSDSLCLFRFAIQMRASSNLHLSIHLLLFQTDQPTTLWEREKNARVCVYIFGPGMNSQSCYCGLGISGLRLNHTKTFLSSKTLLTTGYFMKYCLRCF